MESKGRVHIHVVGFDHPDWKKHTIKFMGASEGYDLIFDVRQFIRRDREQKGKRDRSALLGNKTRKAILGKKNAQDCVDYIIALLEKIVGTSLSSDENKTILTKNYHIVIGCKRGKHRSVSVAHEITSRLSNLVEPHYYYAASAK
ncbi:MAG: hypothetical protein Hyperionvirus2_155 [Hyperionvirus sp.]|uniref:RapZ C-terminal domain-containing protein n=1 Tax=Hyperionvirus sp. TaxID=2487770 RepID=A0A3G5A6C5_9VIRU|nr:MAG: hypothetical protein Hyperionvirus2_155 [Hyperionvirus sp.]